MDKPDTLAALGTQVTGRTQAKKEKKKSTKQKAESRKLKRQTTLSHHKTEANLGAGEGNAVAVSHKT